MRLASGMLVVSCDVPLAAAGSAPEPVVGSFVKGGLAFAVEGEGSVRLVASDPSALLAWGEGGEGSGTADGGASADGDDAPAGGGSEGPGGPGGGSPEGASAADPAASPAPAPAIALPASVAHGGASYELASIGPRALDGCGAASARIPAGVSAIDEAALASPALERVEVDPASPHYASFDGALYGAGLSRLLSIPGGRKGAVRIPDDAGEVQASAFSHCAGAPFALLADADGATLASWDDFAQGASDDEVLALPLDAATILVDSAAPGSDDEGSASPSADASPAAQGEDAAAAGPLAALARSSTARDSSTVRFFGGDGKLQIDGGRFTTSSSGAQTWHEWVDWGSWQSWTLRADLPYAMRGYNGPGFVHYEVNGPYFQGLPGGGTSAVGEGTWRFSIDAQKPGYTFKGWRIGSASGSVAHDGDNEHGSYFTPRGGTDYYASFGTPYSATVRGGGGTFDKYKALLSGYELAQSGLEEVEVSWSASSACYYDGAFDYNDGSSNGWRLRPVRPGYKFVDYEQRSPDGTVTRAPGGGSAQTVPGATYTATWSPITYTISYDANGGTVSGKPTSYNVESASFTLPTPTRSGYTFAGWEVTGAQGAGISTSGAVSTVKRGTYGNLTVKAKWGAPYGATVKASPGTFDKYVALSSGYELRDSGIAELGITWSASSACYYDGAFDYNDGSSNGWRLRPVRPGYKFVDYEQRSPDGTVTRAPGGGSAQTVPGATYTATWSPITYTISYDANGGTVSGKPTSYNVESASFTLPTPTRSGYTFAGWEVTGASGTGVMASGTSATVKRGTYGNLTAKAKWGAPYSATVRAGGGVLDRYRVVSGSLALDQAGLDSVDLVWDASSTLYAAPDDRCVDWNLASGEGWRAKAERPGYRFDGFEGRAPDGTTGVVNGDSGAQGTVPGTTYVALWSVASYALAYDAAGGELAAGARGSYTIEDADFDLPSPTRYGYQFDGWDVSGVAEDGSAGPVLGTGVETVAGADGSKVTRVRAGTYGDLSCTARWTLRYDLDVPVADPGSVTFEADSMTGQVRVKPGTSADGELRSYMAVPVELDELSCEGLDASGAVDPAGGAPELEAIFGAGSASKVRFTATLGGGASALTAKVTAGGAAGSASLAGLSIPAATSKADPGRLAVAYGLELDPGLPIPPVRDAAPVARLAYTVSLAGAGA